MKLLTVVFPLYKEGDTTFILMGKQAPGRKLEGWRNGPGGKVNLDEEPLDGAIREVREEIGVDLKKEDLKYIGLLTVDDKEIYYYTTKCASKLEIKDNAHLVDCRWFDIEKTDEYIDEMLPGDEKLMREFIQQIRHPETFAEFKVDKSNNKELQEATRRIFEGFPKIS